MKVFSTGPFRLVQDGEEGRCLPSSPVDYKKNFFLYLTPLSVVFNEAMSKHRNKYRNRPKPGGNQDHPDQAERRKGRGNRASGKGGGKATGQWLFGIHAVLAALANPERHCLKLLCSSSDEDVLAAIHEASRESERPRPDPQMVARHEINELLPAGAVHQGLAGNFDSLPDVAIETLMEDLAGEEKACVVVLDQATDPRNIGAIMRSAAAFGVAGVIMQDRHAPDATGTLAKAASGALETVPLVHVTNIVRTLETLKKAEFWTVGLDGKANDELGNGFELPRKAAIVMGAEGAGLRRLVEETCDMLVKIPIDPAMESLNLSNATAITFYEWARTQ